MVLKKRFYVLFLVWVILFVLTSSITFALKSNGESCSSSSANDECQSGNCGDAGSTYICCDQDKDYGANGGCCRNDADCGLDMTCKTPSYQCHWKCEFTIGGCCFEDGDCPSGYECSQYASTEWQWGECRYVGSSTPDPTIPESSQPSQPTTDCGDGSCNSGESCSSCSSDCGACQTQPSTPTGTKSDGESCSSKVDCISNNCWNGICCEDNGELCCRSNSDCAADSRVCDDFVCKIINTEWCNSNNQCLSGNCVNNLCCDVGNVCCQHSSECPSGYKCGKDYYCIEETETVSQTTTQKKVDGEDCSSHSDCFSNNCNMFGLESGYGDDGLKICCKEGEECCKKNLDDCSAFSIGKICGDDSYCVSSTGREDGGYCTSDLNCDSGNCEIPEGYTDGRCLKKPLLDSFVAPEPEKYHNLVVSIEPAEDTEAMVVKRFIEEEIYPAIVEIFDTGSSNVFSGPREYDKEIKLVMSDEETVALWDEKNNVMTIPYANVYAGVGMYNKRVIQYNAIAHELTHYHFNGHTEALGGNSNEVPLWFREGISEYGAHEYYKKYMDMSEKTIPTSISEAKEAILAGYLSNKDFNYIETVEDNAIKTVSWKNQGWDWDEDIPDYVNVYYGGAFSIVNFFFKSDTNDKDHLKHIFVLKSGGDSNANFESGFDVYNNNNKNAWFKHIEKEYGSFGLENRPSFFKRMGSFFKGLFGG